MRLAIAWFRFILVIISIGLLFISVLIFFPFSKNFIQQQIRKIWTRALLAATGAKLEMEGYKLANIDLKNSIIVSNHISWLDTVVMLRLCFVQYIGKIEMLNWPILRNIIKSGGTIFIDRKKKKDLLNVNHQVATLLENGATIGLYPEGKTTSGKEILPFKAPLLEAALIAKSQIVPIVINYTKENNERAHEVSFAGVNLLTSVINTLKLTNLTIQIKILKPIDSQQFTSRDKLAEYLYLQVKSHYQQQNMNYWENNNHYPA